MYSQVSREYLLDYVQLPLTWLYTLATHLTIQRSNFQGILHLRNSTDSSTMYRQVSREYLLDHTHLTMYTRLIWLSKVANLLNMYARLIWLSKVANHLNMNTRLIWLCTVANLLNMYARLIWLSKVANLLNMYTRLIWLSKVANLLNMYTRLIWLFDYLQSPFALLCTVATPLNMSSRHSLDYPES